jgi:hypothetical protein
MVVEINAITILLADALYRLVADTVMVCVKEAVE